MRRWDMARSFGSFCIDVTFLWQATKILSHILLRLRLALLLVRFAQPAKVRLRSALVPPFAQNDMLVVCERKFVCFSGRRGRRPLREILIFTVGAIHESPVLTNDNRSFFGRSKPLPYRLIVCERKFVHFREAKQTPLRSVANLLRKKCPSPTANFNVPRRGDSRIARLCAR